MQIGSRRSHARNGRSIAGCFLLLVFVAPQCLATDKFDAAQRLFSLINERLSYMEDVAVFKAQKGIAIEDKQREALVLQNAVLAAARSGIDESSAARLFEAQIEAAKSIQRTVLQRYSSEYLRNTSPRDLEKEIRPALISLGEKILRSASDYLVRYGSIAESEFSVFQQQLDNAYLSPSQAQKLFDALRHLRLSLNLPQGFVDVKDVIPDVRVDLRYFGNHNFVGEVVDGYFAGRLILTEAAAEALSEVQAELRPYGLGVLVFDAYRPQRAVNHFVRWAEDLHDLKNKAEFYPDVPKSELFERDYIASRSSHTRGSTLDLTIATLDPSGEMSAIDMGSGFDFFGPISWPEDASISPQQRANRLLLRTLMLKHGFKPYPKEWWHFTLAEEPFPDTYFDFPIVAN